MMSAGDNFLPSPFSIMLSLNTHLRRRDVIGLVHLLGICKILFILGGWGDVIKTDLSVLLSLTLTREVWRTEFSAR